ncbi:MAG: hypothetical protein WBC74_02875 [Candidatus Omnitrophota bacterium]
MTRNPNKKSQIVFFIPLLKIRDMTKNTAPTIKKEIPPLDLDRKSAVTMIAKAKITKKTLLLNMPSSADRNDFLICIIAKILPNVTRATIDIYAAKWFSFINGPKMISGWITSLIQYIFRAPEKNCTMAKRDTKKPTSVILNMILLISRRVRTLFATARKSAK